MKMSRTLMGIPVAVALALGSPVASAAFTNGAFESGSFTGWTLGGGDRSDTSNSSLTTGALLPGGALYSASIANGHSAVISSGYVDPTVGALLGGTVYSGAYSARIEDTTTGGYASVLSQTVANYTDPSIFFAWKAVLENGGHAANESAEMLIELTDVTTGTLLIRRQYNAGASGVGVDARFRQSGDVFYTPDWQIEQLTVDSMLFGHTFTLSVLAADCEPTGHVGYVYLDGFGAVAPPPAGVPEPASAALLALGLGAVGVLRRRR